MQRVIKRTLLAKAHKARKLKRMQAADDKVRAKLQRESFKRDERTYIDRVKAERQARREDWELGALAPKRDVGLSADSYGFMESREWGRQYLRQPKDVPEKIDFREGDRVVLLEGPDKGKIGPIEKITLENGSLTVEGLNLASQKIPDVFFSINKAEAERMQGRGMPAPIPIAKVRLVYPLPDPETGKLRDVIVSNVEQRNGQRYIPGTDTRLYWPRKKKHSPAVEHPADTPRIDVEAKTFMPVLLEAPMPLTIIDELRNKYGKFRDRHDEDYIASKLAEDEAKEVAKKAANDLRTPLKELNRKLREERAALKERQVLTDEMLVEIGKVMEQNSTLDAILKLQDAKLTEIPVEALPVDDIPQSPESRA